MREFEQAWTVARQTMLGLLVLLIGACTDPTLRSPESYLLSYNVQKTPSEPGDRLSWL